ncbi:polysaccharide biosynthesis tyrosine autokinase [Pontibacter sp. 172403-2]|uniref:GumC family protein n=1 Tax=Pontibacter rufus TaxID=2791028 RepID=UPI0018B00FAB|nr:tyrosine-protein kinase family protein [Pontibacter sp. 172403-2]MBF9252534.1 polysaccharide biosynthesis tyrosine autokinase [Pontibacter sp. 172403-2]
MRDKEMLLQEPEQINLKSVLVKYLRYWYLFVAGIVLFLGIAFLYLRYTTPEYLISSMILIKDDAKSPELSGSGALDSEFNIFQPSKNLSNEVEVLRSKSLMQRVLSELALTTSYLIEGDVKYSEIYGEDVPVKVIAKELNEEAYEEDLTLYLKDRNSFKLQDETGIKTYQYGQQINKPYGSFTVAAVPGASDRYQKITIKFNNVKRLADSYRARLTIEPTSKDASVLAVNLTDAIPERGKDVINKLIEDYNREAMEDKNLVASSTIKFVNERLGYLTDELSDVEKSVESYKRKNDVTDVSSEAQIYLQKESDYNRQLAEWDIQLEVLNSIEKYLSRNQNQYELVPSGLSIDDPTLQGLISQFNELQLERKRTLRTLQPANPLVLNMDEQLGNLRENILENLQNIKKSLEITRENLMASSEKYQSRIQQVPVMERELLEINRQQSIKEGLYLYLLQKREEAAMSLGATVANARVIDSAVSSEQPVEPKKVLVYLFAVLLGLGCPFAFIFIKDMLNDKVQTLQDVEKATATPVLGEIAHKKTDNALVVTADSRVPVAEQFRLIRANLQFATLGKENKVVLISSSMSGEGKTFFSLNLAASLVLAGKRVVLLDFDFRKPGLLRSLGLADEEEGITSYLFSKAVSIHDIIIPSQAMPDLFVIGAGPVPPNPSELMLLPKVGKLIQELKEVFDYVIIDTSPVGQVADALALAPYADATIYMVRNNYTYKAQLDIIDDIHKNRKFNQPMIVINDAQKEAGHAYGYGYTYGTSPKDNKGKIKQGA